VLLSRVLTAAVLLPLAISGIIYLPVNYFAIVLALIFVIGAHEWIKQDSIPVLYDCCGSGFLFVMAVYS